MARVPNWGPSAGQPVPDDQWEAYRAANPPPEGASFSAGTAVQPEGQTGAYLGPSADAPGLVAPQTGQRGAFWQNYFKQQFGGQINAPQFQTGNQDQARLEQQRVIQALQQQARGDLNSLAQQQLQQGYGQAKAQQSSLGSTMRGQGAGAAMRGIQQGQQGIQRSFAGDQQMLMAQEQQAAQALLAQMLQQQQGQDITQAAGMAGGQIQGASMLDNFYRQMMGAGLESGFNAQQNALNMGLASSGFDLESSKINQGLYQDLINVAATGAATLPKMFSGQSNSGYRQVDGQNSIVSEWDK